MKVILALVSILTVTACGSKEAMEAEAKAAAKEAAKTAKEEDKPNYKASAFIVENAKALPTCDDSTEGYLAFTKAKGRFFSCAAGNWEEIDVDGEDGMAGIAGQDGINGKDGKDGQDGINGTNGVNGTNGTNGTNGVNGTNGADGHDYAPLLFSWVGNIEIGRVTHVAYSTSSPFSYQVVRENGMRFELDPSLGTISQATFLYSGTFCSGERRVHRGDNTWANVQVEKRTGKTFRLKAGTNASFTAASSSVNTTCSNATSMNSAYLVDEVTLAGYPWGAVEIQE